MCQLSREVHFFTMQKGSIKLFDFPNYLSMCSMGGLKFKKGAVISVANRWVMLLSPVDVQSVEHWLMLGWEEEYGVMGQSYSPRWKLRGAVLPYGNAGTCSEPEQVG